MLTVMWAWGKSTRRNSVHRWFLVGRYKKTMTKCRIIIVKFVDYFRKTKISSYCCRRVRRGKRNALRKNSNRTTSNTDENRP